MEHCLAMDLCECFCSVADQLCGLLQLSELASRYFVCLLFWKSESAFFP